MGGKIVETKYIKGYTKNEDKMINGKIIVYTDLINGKKILCDPKNVKTIGFYD